MLVASSPSREGLQEVAKKFYFSPNVVLNDDGTVSNSKGVIPSVLWVKKNNRYRLELKGEL